MSLSPAMLKTLVGLAGVATNALLARSDKAAVKKVDEFVMGRWTRQRNRLLKVSGNRKARKARGTVTTTTTRTRGASGATKETSTMVRRPRGRPRKKV